MIPCKVLSTILNDRKMKISVGIRVLFLEKGEVKGKISDQSLFFKNFFHRFLKFGSFQIGRLGKIF